MGNDGSKQGEGKRSMLIVDDMPLNRAMLSQLFQQDYRIIEAANGKEAVEVIEKNPEIRVMLLDMMMPVMDGFEVLSFLQQHNACADIPVVALTQRGQDALEARVLEAGASDFVTKPFNPIVVRRRVENVCARSENAWRKEEQAAQSRQIREMRAEIDKDSLTGIYNRETFYRRTAFLMQQNAEEKFSVICFNIRSFREINELFRVETGNIILKAAAYYLSAVAGEEGVCGRLEADHFALCLPQEQADMDLIMEGLDDTVRSLGLSHNVYFYAGVYPVEHIYLPVDQMLDRAHLALRRANQEHQRWATYTDEMRQKLQREQTIVRDMEFALKEKQFVVYYQPVFDISGETPRFMGAEALARWQHPVDGIIDPVEFVPLFEHNGFIIDLDHFVWQQVASSKAGWREKGWNFPVSVNVSRLNFFDEGLPLTLEEIRRQYALEPESLWIEIEEEAYLSQPQTVIKKVEDLHTLGYHVVLDRFGMGAASLKTLRDLPVDGLKCNLAFGQEPSTHAKAEALLDGTFRVAKKLGIKVIAEGVGKEVLLDVVRRAGGQLAQGYYLQEPMSEEAFEAFLEKQAQDQAETPEP